MNTKIKLNRKSESWSADLLTPTTRLINETDHHGTKRFDGMYVVVDNRVYFIYSVRVLSHTDFYKLDVTDEFEIIKEEVPVFHGITEADFIEIVKLSITLNFDHTLRLVTEYPTNKQQISKIQCELSHGNAVLTLITLHESGEITNYGTLTKEFNVIEAYRYLLSKWID